MNLAYFLFLSLALVMTSCISSPTSSRQRQQGPRPVYHQPQPVPRPESIYSSGQASPQLQTTTIDHSSSGNTISPIFTNQSAQVSNESVRREVLNVLKTSGLSKEKINLLIESNLTNLEDVELALKDPELQSLRPQLLMKYGKILQKNRNYSAAADAYRSLLSQYPQATQAAQAKTQYDLMLSLEKVNPYAVGAVLPLTGKSANVGQHALNAIKMGLGIAQNNSGSRIQLFVYDNQSNPDLAAVGVQKLVQDHKVIALVGGLSSKEATIIAEKADLLSIPFIAMTQKSGLTHIGDFIFRNALTPEMQVNRLVDYATEKIGAKRFGILYPNDSYGVEFANIFWDKVLAKGGQLTAIQTYDPKENDFTGVVQKLVGTYYTEARQQEYNERLEEMRKAAQARERKLKKENRKVVRNSRERQATENVLPPIIDFDVLFVPDTGKALSQVISFMKVNDVQGITYLGTNIWNTQDVARRSSGQKDKIFFSAASDQTDPDFKNTTFYQEYFSVFNEEPTIIEIQSYESAKLILDALRAGVSDRLSLASNLRSRGRVQGVNTELKMNENRELERPVYLFSVENGNLRKIE